MQEFFFRPAGAWAGDFIPFFKDGRFRLFYLHDWRDREKHGEGTSWFQVSTQDFIDFEQHGEMLQRGTKEEQDLYVFTGSVIEGEGSYHIFYTGHNPYFRERGKPEQGVMHAISQDLLRWEKVPEDTFYARTDIYEPHDWRDPFVFWNEQEGRYWMLLAARLKHGPSRRRGCTALCSSKDLKNWEPLNPFWSPSLYYTHECPDLFKMGNWHYLVYSTFTERCVTHYRMSRSLTGPWLAPENDSFDGRAFYAAKTYSDGSRRYVFGWNPTREGERDYQAWQWGGNLVVHQVVQQEDGTISVKVPETVDRAFTHDTPVEFTPRIGNWVMSETSLAVSAPDSFACAVAQTMPRRCKIAGRITFDEDTRSCGLTIRTSEDLENAYYVRLEPRRNRLVFDSWPRKGDNPFMVELERPLELLPGRPCELKVFVDDTICEVYANDKVAMSSRLYDLKEGRWGFFVSEGAARLDGFQLCQQTVTAHAETERQ